MPNLVAIEAGENTSLESPIERQHLKLQDTYLTES